MIVDDSGRIFVNTFDAAYPQLRSFLTSCCEPVCRTHFVNEYVLTTESLAAAASEGTFTEDDIRRILREFGSNGAASGAEDAGAPAPLVGAGEGTTSAARAEKQFVMPPAVDALLIESARSRRLRIFLQPVHAGVGRVHASMEHDATPTTTTTTNGAPHTAVPAATTGGLAYFLASEHRSVIDAVASDAVVAECLVSVRIAGVLRLVYSDIDGAAAPATIGSAGTTSTAIGLSSTAPRVVYKAQIKSGMLRKLRRHVQDTLGYHVDCYYDYAADALTPPVPNFSLKPSTRLRPYQEASLERFRAGTKVRNGIVVLPCGAGKTLTGIAAAALVGKRAIVMCISVQSALQWREQFLLWTNLRPSQVTICTSDQKDDPGDVFITTYSMLTAGPSANGAWGIAEATQAATTTATAAPAGSPAAGPPTPRPGGLLAHLFTDEPLRSAVSAANAQRKSELFAKIRSAVWGLLVLDEVHIAPADSFQRIVDTVRFHCALGLTATLLREDSRIGDLRFLVGPKLYEANWLELARAGHLATVQCAEVRCPLPPAFLHRYLRAPTQQTKTDIECMNPTKFWAAQALIRFHSTRHPPDKTIVFCDSVIAARWYAERLGLPLMIGDTRATERANLLGHFRHNPRLNTLVISRVGDTALDLPEATVIIQVSFDAGSRRQEAQRLGRILRPKPPSMDNASAFFYTVVSTDTDEANFSFSRQRWLRDQGFSYRVVAAADVFSHFGFASAGGAASGDASPTAARSGPPGTVDEKSSWGHSGATGGLAGLPAQQQQQQHYHHHQPLQLCCVGPPLWCVRVSVAAARQAPNNGDAAPPRARRQWRWQPLDAAASALIERGFLNGRREQRVAHLRGKAVFDAADAPHTFGAFTFAEANGEPGDGADGGAAADGEAALAAYSAPRLVTGRLRRGALPGHVCGAACLEGMLDKMGLRPRPASDAGGGTGGAGAGGAAPGPRVETRKRTRS